MAQCAQTGPTGLLTLVPPTRINRLEPAIVCNSSASLVATGTGFVVDGQTNPLVSVTSLTGSTPLPSVVNVTLGSCTELGPLASAQLCRSMDLILDASSVPEGVYSLHIDYPAFAGLCPLIETESLHQFYISSPPSISAALPSLFCDSAFSTTLSGSFPQHGSVGLYSATLSTVAAFPGMFAAANCSTVPLQSAELVQVCTLLSIDGPAIVELGLQTALPNVLVEFANCKSNSLALQIPALRVDSLSPASVCKSSVISETNVTVRGRFATSIVASDLTLQVAGTSKPAVLDSCTVDLVNPSFQTCTELSFGLSAAEIVDSADDEILLSISSMGCSVSAYFYRTPPPTLLSVLPSFACGDQSARLSLFGANFTNGTAFYLENFATGTLTLPSLISVISGTLAELVLAVDPTDPATFLPAGFYNVIAAGGSCQSVLPSAVQVLPLVFLFDLAPRASFVELNLTAVLFVSGADNATQFELVNSSGQATQLSIVESSADLSQWKILLDHLPAGLYHINARTGAGCQGSLQAALKVTAVITLNISTVSPTFLSALEGNSIVVSGMGFEQTSSWFLNGPVGVALGQAEMTLAGTEFSIEVDGGLPLGTYDLVVVNNDGQVGVLRNALTVLGELLPLIYSATPDAFVTGTVTSRLLGQNFQNGLSAVLECQAWETSQTQSVSATAAWISSTTVDITFSATSAALDVGTACVVQLTNPSGAGTFYSAIAIKSASGNLNQAVGWRTYPERLNEARRQHCLVAGQPTTTTRYFYAIGGDAGTIPTAKNSIEFASVTRFGLLRGPWQTLARQGALPHALTGHTCNTIGQFIYLTGGQTANGTVQSAVWRAHILEPIAVTVRPGILLNQPSNLTAGRWLYQISALYDASHEENPQGESLPSVLISVNVPSVPGPALLLTWTAVPGASGYRLYRIADLNSSQPVLLAETTLPLFTDYGAPINANQRPLQRGSLGNWGQVGSTLFARFNHASAAVAVGNQQHLLYVFAGSNAAGTAFNKWEVLSLTEVNVGDSLGGSSSSSAATSTSASTTSSAASSSSPAATSTSASNTSSAASSSSPTPSPTPSPLPACSTYANQTTCCGSVSSSGACGWCESTDADLLFECEEASTCPLAGPNVNQCARRKRQTGPTAAEFYTHLVGAWQDVTLPTSAVKTAFGGATSINAGDILALGGEHWVVVGPIIGGTASVTAYYEFAKVNQSTGQLSNWVGLDGATGFLNEGNCLFKANQFLYNFAIPGTEQGLSGQLDTASPWSPAWAILSGRPNADSAQLDLAVSLSACSQSAAFFVVSGGCTSATLGANTCSTVTDSVQYIVK